MKTNPAFRLLSPFVLVLLLTTAIFSQSPKKVYSEVYYQKLKPGHTFAEARAMENEFKKIHQVQADEGSIVGWYMLALDMTSNPNKEYNYVTIKSFSDSGYMDNAYPEAVLKKVMGADYQAKLTDLSKRMTEIREVTKAEIWQTLDGDGVTPMPSPSKFPVWVANSIKIKNGQYSQYIDQINKLKPAMKERINQGNLVGWNLTSLLYPSSTEKGCDFGFLSYYPNAKQLLDVDEEAAFKKAMPGTDIAKYYSDLDQIRDRTRQEVYYLLEYAVKGASTTTVAIPPAVSVSQKTLDSYVGVYEGKFRDNPKATFTVTREGSRLFEELTGGDKLEIVPETETKFYFKDMNAQLEFIKDKSGKVTKRMLVFNGETSEAKKIK